MRYVSSIFFILFLWCAAAQAKEVSWKYLHMVDADTLLFQALWVPFDKKVILVRLYGIDAAESGYRAKCKAELELSIKAKEYVRLTLEHANSITLEPISWDKWGGRILARVFVDQKDLSKLILENGYAREYYGERKKGWC